MTPIARLARRIARMPATALPACAAALCLALIACAQPPTPQAAPHTPLLPSVATPTSPPTTLTPPAAASHPISAHPTPPPTPTAAPAPPSVAIPTPAAQPTPSAPPIFPPADVVFTQLTAGKTHACGLRESGGALCWGYDRYDYGSLDVPDETDFRQISAGLHFTCALRQDGTIACWGNNSAGQASPPQGSFSEIAAGNNHVCAIPISQGSPLELVCWGGTFPNGAETLPLDAPLSDIQAGGDSTCGLTPQADMACLSIERRLTEVTPGPFTQLAAGLAHICALREDGNALAKAAMITSKQPLRPPNSSKSPRAGDTPAA